MTKRSENRRLRFEQLETKTTLSSLLQTFAIDAPVDASESLVAEFEAATQEVSVAAPTRSVEVLRFVHDNTYSTQEREWTGPTLEEGVRADQMLSMSETELHDLF